MVRYAAIVGLAALVAGLWALYGLAGDFRVFGGVSTAHVMLWAAWLTTALLLVLIIGRLLLAFGAALLSRDATGLQRGIIYAVVAFVVLSAVLAALGTNVTAILTTSFIATAILGLAMQSTIGGLIAGSALQLDRVLRVGDVIVLNREPIEITSMSWRSVVGRKPGGVTVIVPNARIAESQVEVIRGGEPVHIEAAVAAALAEVPHRVGQALMEAIYDLPGVDASRPVDVAPAEYQLRDGYVSYRVAYWVRRHRDVIRTQALLMSRAWYVFQREDIRWLGRPGDTRPPNATAPFDTEPFKGARLDRLADLKDAELQSVVLARGLAGDLVGRTIAECGPPLCYADGERIMRPHRVKDFSLYLLVDGEVSEAAGDAWRDGAPAQAHERHAMLSSRSMAVERVASHLARVIGPYAEVAVREAAAIDPDPVAVRDAVASEIEDTQKRESFLRGLLFHEHETYKPGFLFGLQSGAYRRMSSPPLRAVRSAVVVPIVLGP
jgi:small-conductance mechanosensitive channel